MESSSVSGNSGCRGGATTRVPRETRARDGATMALIDTGALVTGMDNREVAQFLLDHLPAEKFDGVVYLDRADRKMCLLREGGRSVTLDQAGVRVDRRFTFYDQIHTTGMDIAQAPTAKAVVWRFL